MLLRIGDLRERITIRRRQETKNNRGGLDIGWATVASSLAAKVVNLNGREAVIGNVLQGISVFDIIVRYRTDIQAADQLLWNGRELNIVNAEDRLGTRQWIVIQATSAAPQGA